MIRWIATLLVAVVAVVALVAMPVAAEAEATPLAGSGGAYLGVVSGVVVVRVAPDSPAAKADVRAKDIVLTANGKPITHTGEFKQLVQGLKPGDVLSLTLLRGGQELPESPRRFMEQMPERGRRLMPSRPLGGA